ncbi:MAG: riboflavin synthase [Candidatus Magasanikbacteria bacterium]
MFTGIIQNLGKIEKIVKSNDSSSFYISAPDNYFTKIKIGSSIAINGVCLTAEEITNEKIKLTAVKQTLQITNLSDLKENDLVNLELPCTAESFLGGHIVMGHVDEMAEAIKIEKLAVGKEIWLKIPEEFSKYIIKKGSITLDGTSMTVAEKFDNQIKVAVIPETIKNTRFGIYQVGDKVNFEVDVIGKYVENFINNKEL